MKKINSKKQKKKNVFVITTFSLLVLMVLVTVSGLSVYHLQLSALDLESEKATDTEYDKYVAMITGDASSEFWQDVYAGAKSTGDEEGNYVEVFARDMGVDYSVEERMEIAIASKVDGIILEGSETEALREQIERAKEENIPVVLVRRDLMDCERICFVGISQYELGQTYGMQTLELAGRILDERMQANPNEGRSLEVMVLVSQEGETGGQNLLVTGIREEIAKSEEVGKRIDLQTYAIDDSGSFAAEESIRDIFIEREDAPDILICLSELHTTCAYQAVIDYNKVGITNMIGYYDSETILNGIEKGIIYSTVSMDAEQMGTYCATALSEYLEMGLASEYFSVDTYVVNRENVEQYMEGQTDEISE